MAALFRDIEIYTQYKCIDMQVVHTGSHKQVAQIWDYQSFNMSGNIPYMEVLTNVIKASVLFYIIICIQICRVPSFDCFIGAKHERPVTRAT